MAIVVYLRGEHPSQGPYFTYADTPPLLLLHHVSSSNPTKTPPITTQDKHTAALSPLSPLPLYICAPHQNKHSLRVLFFLIVIFQVVRDKMELALRDMGMDASMLTAIHEMLDIEFDEEGRPMPAGRPGGCQPSRTFVRDNKAIRATKADILEYPNSYVFIVDMPGVKPEDIKVQVEDGNVLVVSGERRRDKERENKEGVRYVRMERRQGKFFKKFELPDNANLDSISATYQDGVLTITVEKKLPEQKPAKTIEVKVLGGGGGGQIGGVGSGADEGREQRQEQAVDESAGGGVQG